jgi:hypothetical protein
LSPRPRGKAAHQSLANPYTEVKPVIVLGLILAIAGALLDIGIVVTLGVILIVVGVIFWILGALDRPVLGRRYYY